MLKPKRVLLDECLPKKLKREFPNCTVAMAQEMGWAGKNNGELMKVARGEFDILVTSDQNLRYQQNLIYADIGIIVLIAISNRIEALKPLMPKANEALQRIKPGEVMQVEAET